MKHIFKLPLYKLHKKKAYARSIHPYVSFPKLLSKFILKLILGMYVH